MSFNFSNLFNSGQFNQTISSNMNFLAGLAGGQTEQEAAPQQESVNYAYAPKATPMAATAIPRRSGAPAVTAMVGAAATDTVAAMAPVTMAAASAASARRS